MVAAGWILVFLVLILCVLTSMEDLREGLIRNRTLKPFLVGFLGLDMIYYGFFAREYILLFLVNLAGVAMISLLMYAWKIWAGGDCKLFVTIALGIPAEIYTGMDLGPVPGFLIFMIMFSAAFLYETGESVYLTIRDRERMKVSWQNIRIWDLLSRYLFFVGIIYLINLLLALVMEKMHLSGILFPGMIDFIAILAINRLTGKTKKELVLSITVAEWIIIILVFGVSPLSISASLLDLKPWLTVIVVFLLRVVSEKYNYLEIPTSSVKAKMILSSMCVLGFRASRVKGLPVNVSEDLGARLTEAEADAVRRWEKSKTGKSTVMIVRKIPFAFFIAVGTALFLVIGVLLL